MRTGEDVYARTYSSSLYLSLLLSLHPGLHPTPDVEITFWKTKAANLNAVYDQLQSQRVKKVRERERQERWERHISHSHSPSHFFS
jgi:hypothetical protein